MLRAKVLRTTVDSPSVRARPSAVAPCSTRRPSRTVASKPASLSAAARAPALLTAMAKWSAISEVLAGCGPTKAKISARVRRILYSGPGGTGVPALPAEIGSGRTTPAVAPGQWESRARAERRCSWGRARGPGRLGRRLTARPARVRRWASGECPRPKRIWTRDRWKTVFDAAVGQLA